MALNGDVVANVSQYFELFDVFAKILMHFVVCAPTHSASVALTRIAVPSVFKAVCCILSVCLHLVSVRALQVLLLAAFQV